MTTKTTRTALDAYMEHHGSALALVERIHDAIENHDGAAPLGLNWSHVGDITETERQLQEIADFMFGGGVARNEPVREAVKLIAAERRSWPRPTADMPDIETIINWSHDGEMEATDGCGGVEDDGFCDHGHPSWMLELGMI